MPVPDPSDDRPELDPALTAQALLYAHGELDGPAEAAFEARLGVDQSAREALCEAVQLTSTLGGSAAPAPDPCYRERVSDQLLAQPGRGIVGARWWTALAGPRLYRGHPAMWALAGALAALLLVQPWLSHHGAANAEPLLAQQDSQRSTREAPAVAMPQPRAGPETATTTAEVWAELQSDDHLVRACTEEQKRRHRHEERRVLHPEENGGRGVSH